MSKRIKVMYDNGNEAWEDNPLFQKDVGVPNGIQGLDMQGFPMHSGVHGGCYISTPGDTTVTNAGTFYLLQGTTTTQNGFQGVAHASPGRLSCVAAMTHTVKIDITLSITTSANNTIVKIRLAKNGVTEPASEQSAKKTIGTDISSLATQMLVQVSPNDYFEVFVTCDAQGATVTALTGTMAMVTV